MNYARHFEHPCERQVHDSIYRIADVEIGDENLYFLHIIGCTDWWSMNTVKLIIVIFCKIIIKICEIYFILYFIYILFTGVQSFSNIKCFMPCIICRVYSYLNGDKLRILCPFTYFTANGIPPFNSRLTRDSISIIKNSDLRYSVT